MHKVICVILLVLLFFGFKSVCAQEAVSLESLIEEAKKNNPEILSAKKRYEAAKARIPQAKSLEDPSVGLTFEKIPRGTLKINKTMPDDRMLSLTQAVPFFGKLSLKGKIALVESQMAVSEYKAKEITIVKEVKKAYYDLFMNYKEIELTKTNLTLLRGIVKIAEGKYMAGQLPQEEVAKINLEIARLSNNSTNLLLEKQSKETTLNTLLNRAPEAPLVIPVLIEDNIAFDKESQDLYRLAITNQPELMIFSYAIEKNKYAKSLAKRSLFPDFMAGIVQRGITSGTIGPWDLMLSFTVPLWFWTKQRYEVKEAIANLDEARAAYEVMKNKVIREVKSAYSNVKIARSRMDLSGQSLLPVLENTIASSISAFRSGKGDAMALLDTERMLIETKMDYYKSLVEYNMNLAELEQVVGVDFSR
jgi:outer membrane protein TolC